MVREGGKEIMAEGIGLQNNLIVVLEMEVVDRVEVLR